MTRYRSRMNPNKKSQGREEVDELSDLEESKQTKKFGRFLGEKDRPRQRRILGKRVRTTQTGGREGNTKCTYFIPSTKSRRANEYQTAIESVLFRRIMGSFVTNFPVLAVILRNEEMQELGNILYSEVGDYVEQIYEVDWRTVCKDALAGKVKLPSGAKEGLTPSECLGMEVPIIRPKLQWVDEKEEKALRKSRKFKVYHRMKSIHETTRDLGQNKRI